MFAVRADSKSNQPTNGIAIIRAVVLVAFSGAVLWYLLWKLAALLWAIR